MANPEDVHTIQSSTSSGARTRRTGLLTVMERPPGKSLLQLFCLKCVKFLGKFNFKCFRGCIECFTR